MKNLTNKTIIVTGVASGIGAQTARILRSRGARVIGLDRNDALDPLDRFIKYDQSAQRSIEAAIEALDGNVDALCNIAGVPPTVGAEKVLKINFLGLRSFIEGAAGKLKDGAVVINVSSMAGFMWQQNLPFVNALMDLKSIEDAGEFCDRMNIVSDGMTPTSSYPLSKQAATAWTIRNFNRWADRGIRMNVVSPGPVATPILKDFHAALGDVPKTGFMAGLRDGTPDDIAKVIAFMCCDDAAWLNGINLPTDGGLSAFLTNEFGPR
ncbi:MAG: coniferyl-alcohol dehydrogenase [Proteobacteria bacterium]|nr:coniferyl-alcohol dehydrogenase [Pseudomonadota bacterium]